MYAVLIALIVLVIYIAAYMLHGKALLERRVVKADPSRLTPAWEKFDGVDYVPANKYVLYGHHFASIAGAGPIIGPATALAWGWLLPLIWVLFGNIFIGAVHDYTSIMASVRYGGVSVMTVSENVMGRKARYIFLAYVYFALVLVLAAFLSVASSTFAVLAPTAATVAIIYMPLALLFGILVYKVGLSVKKATLIALVLTVLALIYSLNAPTYLTYEGWIVVLSLYSILAAALPVWYLLQPRDYLNAYLLWSFVALAVLAPFFLIPTLTVTGPAVTSLVATGGVIGAVGAPSKWSIAWFWPTVPLVIACGALSGFHSLVGSGTTSKQLSNELDALFIGYGGMLTEGAVSSLAVILPAALVWDFAKAAAALGVSTDLIYKAGINLTATPTILGFAGAARFYTIYGFSQALAWSRVAGVEAFPSLYKGFYTFAAWALTAFVLTTLDTCNRLARFAWTEFFDWLKPRAPGAYKVICNRWAASIIPVLLGALMAYPKLPDPADPTKIIYAYLLVWPAFAGTNQLLAALALLTTTLWVYAILKVRGGPAMLMLVPALFLWVTVTAALIIWLALIVPYLPALYVSTAGVIVAISVALDFALIALFVRGLLLARKAT